MNKLGVLIKQKRKEQNLTQADLEKVLDITRISISHFENGQPIGFKSAQKLAEWLEIPTWQVNMLANTKFMPISDETIRTVTTIELVEIADLLNQYNLTPENLKTLIKGISALL